MIQHKINYANNNSGGFARGGKVILNLGFMEEYGDTGINYGHIVFHEIGHAVGLRHIVMEINGVEYTDFPDNVMGSEYIPLRDGEGQLYRLRKMWIRDYKRVDYLPQIFSQLDRYQDAYDEWKDPNRLTP